MSSGETRVLLETLAGSSAPALLPILTSLGACWAAAEREDLTHPLTDPLRATDGYSDPADELHQALWLGGDSASARTSGTLTEQKRALLKAAPGQGAVPLS